jgi:site-specific DNA-cytosine methylase
MLTLIYLSLQKTMEQSGESGQTWRGMINWIRKAEPPIVIIENVRGAPWDKKIKIFEGLGYHAIWCAIDTKQYYIPHTRQRGYLFAIKKKVDNQKAVTKIDQTILIKWKQMLEKLRRPASAALDAFMLPNDDPRVLRGRARLTSSSRPDSSDRNNRVDWTKCEARHQFARANEELGEKRPLTGWSDTGNTTMPAFAWNEWANGQVHRIHDLLDISTLRCAQEGIDCTYKTMVWNISQNVDRDTMGKLGLCQCLTPTGVPYVSNRGGPLVGEELLLLQGIPADDLLLTKESEDNLKDLAGNAMSTTVVGACMLGALILGHAAIGPGSAGKSTDKVRTSATGCLVF